MKVEFFHGLNFGGVNGEVVIHLLHGFLKEWVAQDGPKVTLELTFRELECDKFGFGYIEHFSEKRQILASLLVRMQVEESHSTIEDPKIVFGEEGLPSID